MVDQATRPHKMPKRLPPPPRDHAEPAAPSGSVRGLPPPLSGFENGLSLAAPAPGIRDIGTYCVPGEKPDNHPEGCCADRETYLWTCHHARLVGASDSSLPHWVAAEIAAAGRRVEPVEVQLIDRAHLADLVIIGSHCVRLDVLIGRLHSEGISVKALNVGSTGGLAAAKRGDCDIAAIHLMDPATGEYNRPFLTPALELVSGYRRLQGIVYRKGDRRFEGRSLEDAIGGAIVGPDCLMVNRNAGSGTRILTGH
jgi:hypothetical protein